MAEASTTLINKIKTILQGISNLNSDAIYTYETAEITKFPSVTIVETGNEAEFETNIDNKRIYKYNIRIYVEKSQSGDDQSEKDLRQIRDQIIDELDKDPYFSGISLPTGYSMISTRAAPMRFGYIERGGDLRVAEIEFEIIILVDTSLI